MKIKNTKLPELFCEEGTRVISIKEMILEDDTVIPKGTKCQVEGIIGYGFDLRTDTGIDVRVINSQMDEYFDILITKGIDL